jgi:hypothetical protein
VVVGQVPRGQAHGYRHHTSLFSQVRDLLLIRIASETPASGAFFFVVGD